MQLRFREPNEQFADIYDDIIEFFDCGKQTSLGSQGASFSSIDRSENAEDSLTADSAASG